MRSVVLSAVIAVMCITDAYAEVYKYGSDSAETTQGPLSVQWLDEQDPQKGTKVLLRGRSLTELSSSATIKATYANGKDADLILLALDSGGFGCPWSFQVIELRRDGSFTLSNEFGNCNALADRLYFRVDDNPVFRSDEWFIALAGKSKRKTAVEGHEMREKDKGEVEWFRYSEGKVSRAKRPDVQ